VQRVNDLSVCMVFSPWLRQGATRSRGSEPRGLKTWRGHGPKSAFDISLILGIVRLDKSLCRSHDVTLVRDGLAWLKKCGSLVGATERYINNRLHAKYMP
jgi:hypothetical protein